jgi:hypothetical protein
VRLRAAHAAISSPCPADGCFAAAARLQRALTMIGLQARRVIAPLGRAVTAGRHDFMALRRRGMTARGTEPGPLVPQDCRPHGSAQLPHGLARAAPVRKLLELMSAERSGHGY